MPAAQAPAIAGRVTDMSQASMPGVTVTIVPERGGVALHTTSDRDGGYQFEEVPEDTYRVDFSLLGFEVARRNHVRVRAGTSNRIDAALKVGRPCEYPAPPVQAPSESRSGQVLDEIDRPLPHATLELVANGRRESAYADREGRFIVRVPDDGKWALTVYDTGFGVITHQISRATAEPLVFKLRYTGTQDVSDNERLDRRGRCPWHLFAHEAP
jgi:hypothetical protein